MNYSIKARNILYKDSLFEGYICIEGESIAMISSTAVEEYPAMYTYDVEVVMPAAIDSNVNLTMWEGVDEFSKLAIQGGVSLIVNGSQNLIHDPSQQIAILNRHCRCDFIQAIEVDAIDDLKPSLVYETHLMPHFNGTHCKDVAELTETIQRIPSGSSLFIHMQCAFDKDLGITSPFRSTNLQERLSVRQLDLVDADGFHGTLDSDDDQLQSEQQNEQLKYLDDVNSPIRDIVKKYRKSDEVTLQQDPLSPLIDSVVFKNKSKKINHQTQLSLLSRAELFTYESKYDRFESQPVVSEYKFPQEPAESPQLNTSNNLMFVGVKQESGSPLQSEDSGSNKKVSPQFSVLSSEQSSSPDSIGIHQRLRTRSNTQQSLLQRRQSKQGFQIQLKHVETQKPSINRSQEGSQNFSESRVRTQVPRFNTDYLSFLTFRPGTWEGFALSRVKKAIKQPFQCNIILRGYSSALTLVEVKAILNQQIFTDLSYPHILIDSENIQDRQTMFKSDPPIRQKGNKHLLQKAITQGWVSSISSQHLFVNPIYKFEDFGDFRRAFSGLNSIGCTFPALWTIIFCKKDMKPYTFKQALETKDLDNPSYRRLLQKLLQLQQLLSLGPAQYLNLKRYGRIESGYQADLVVFDPLKDIKFIADDRHILNKRRFLGKVRDVFIRGQLACVDGQAMNRQGIQVGK